MKSILIVLALALSGCTSGGFFKTKSGVKVTPPANAEKASTSEENISVESFVIPKASKITVTEIPATPTTPASKVTEFVPSADTLRKIETTISAISVSAPRAPDQSVALRSVDNQERRPFLYVALGLALATGALAYFRLMPIAKLTALGAGIALGLWWAIGNEKLLTWMFGILAAVTAGYFIYSDWVKGRLQGTLEKTVQSVEEFATDHPKSGEELKQQYLAPNMDQAHKDTIAKIEPKIDTTYIDEVVKEKLTTQPTTPT